MLPEPFKVRAISVGQGLPYFRSQALQKLLHRAMQLVPELRVTKESPDHTIVEVLNEVLGVRLRPGEVWVSGDYTGATDNLKSEVSEIIVSEICRVAQLSDSTSRLFKVALTGHGLELPNGDVIAQTNGQLMGSPVSFPVLCIANLALTVVALRRVEGQTSRPIGHSGIAINGYDIWFGAGPDGIASWKEVTTEGGLSQSGRQELRE